MTNLNVFLDNNNSAIFFAGQVLKGTIELHLSEIKKVNGLYFVLKGRAKCHWTETEQRTTGTGENRRTETHTVHYHGQEDFMNTKTYLFGHQGGQAVEMPAGTHRYTFEALIPPMVPGSFEAAHGNIRYNIEACLDIPWRFDKETKVQFTVVRNDDLNLFPELKIPCRNEQMKTFCCLFCKSEPLMMTVTIPCGGFTPGSSIPINIDYFNKSDVDVTRTKINLKRIIKLNSQTPHHKTKFEVEKMAEVFKEGVGVNSSKTIVENLQLPHILVNTNNRYCNVVQVTYDLKVEAEVSGCHSNFEMVFPIVIGNIPINFDQQGQVPLNGQITYDNPDGMTQLPYNPSFPIPDAPIPSAPMNNEFTNPMADLPPSFEEAIKINNEKAESSYLPQQPQQGFGWNFKQ